MCIWGKVKLQWCAYEGLGCVPPETFADQKFKVRNFINCKALPFRATCMDSNLGEHNYTTARNPSTYSNYYLQVIGWLCTPTHDRLAAHVHADSMLTFASPWLSTPTPVANRNVQWLIKYKLHDSHWDTRIINRNGHCMSNVCTCCLVWIWFSHSSWADCCNCWDSSLRNSGQLILHCSWSFSSAT